MVTIRIRSWRPAIPSISGPRSTVPSSFTVTPFVSSAIGEERLANQHPRAATAWLGSASSWGPNSDPAALVGESDTLKFLPNLAQQCSDFCGRPKMMNPLVPVSLRHKLPVLGSPMPMAGPEHAITVDCATEHRTALWPSFRSYEDALE